MSLESDRELLIKQPPREELEWEAEQKVERKQIPLERFQTLEHVIKEHPVSSDPYLELAKIYLQSDRSVDARRVLDLAVARFPEDEEVLYLHEESQILRARQLQASARIEHDKEPTQLTKEACERSLIEVNVLREKICRARLQRHPDQLELNMPLAGALEILGNHEEAAERLQQAMQRPDLRARAALQLGKLFERLGKIPEALSAYRQCAFFRVPPPSNDMKFEALRLAADLAERSNLLDSARRYVEACIEVLPTDTPDRQRQAFEERLKTLQAAEL